MISKNFNWALLMDLKEERKCSNLYCYNPIIRLGQYFWSRYEGKTNSSKDYCLSCASHMMYVDLKTLRQETLEEVKEIIRRVS